MLTQEQKEHPELFITCQKCGNLGLEKKEDWNATMTKAFAYSDELQAKVSSQPWLTAASWLMIMNSSTSRSAMGIPQQRVLLRAESVLPADIQCCCAHERLLHTPPCKCRESRSCCCTSPLRRPRSTAGTSSLCRCTRCPAELCAVLHACTMSAASMRPGSWKQPYMAAG